MSREENLLVLQRARADADALRSRVAELEDELVEWKRLAQEALVGADSDTLLEINNPWKLSRAEMTILLTILRRRSGATKEQLMLALYGAHPDRQPECKIIDVFLCKLRKKLSDPQTGKYTLPRDTIETVWGTGYRIGPDKRKIVTDMLGHDPLQFDRPEQTT
jgi:DNA-binding response OmpR family regulator